MKENNETLLMSLFVGIVIGVFFEAGTIGLISMLFAYVLLRFNRTDRKLDALVATGEGDKND